MQFNVIQIIVFLFFTRTVASENSMVNIVQTEIFHSSLKFKNPCFFKSDTVAETIPPAFSAVPSGLSFSCNGRLPGYYADVEARCQASGNQPNI